MKKIIKFVYGFLIFCVVWQTSVFAEPQPQYIEYWENGIAYNSRNEVIANCEAYDYLSEESDKFVRLNTAGKETARFAAPGEAIESGGQVTGTAELSATVPDNITNAVEVVLWDSNSNPYTLTAYKDNNYVAHANIPTGTYSVFSAGIKDDFKGEYPAKCNKNELVIEPSTASKLEVTISEKQDLTNPLTYKGVNGEKDNLQLSEASKAEDKDAENTTNIDTKSLLKSTIVTFSILAILLLSYKLVVWYRNRKNMRTGGN